MSDHSEYLNKFKQEADDIVWKLNQGIVELEDAPDEAEKLAEVIRLAHSLKGVASMVGVVEVSKTAHIMEDVLTLVRGGKQKMHSELSDVLFQALDSIQLQLNQLIGMDADRDPEAETVRLKLKAIQQAGGTLDEPPAEALSRDEPDYTETEPVPEEGEIGTAIDLSEFIGPFKAEAQEILDQLNLGLLELEKNSTDPEVLAQIARAAHTLKGSSKMMGFDEISAIAHRMEDLLKVIRDGYQLMTVEISDHLFAGLDAMHALLEAGTGGAPANIDVQAISKVLEQMASDEPPSETVPNIEKTVPEPTESPLKAFVSTAEAATTEPAQPSTPSTVTEEIQVPSDTSTNSEGQGPITRVLSSLQETIRVDTGKVDDLVNVAGEMVVNQIRFDDRLTSLKQLLAEVKDIHRSWHHVREHLLNLEDVTEDTTPGLTQIFDSLQEHSTRISSLSEEFSSHVREVADDTASLNILTGGLQHEVMGLRMVPISMVFDTFKRTIRDLAREMGKRIEPNIEGRETELDKKMIEGLKEPLVHLVRNSIDHGIEPPEIRSRLGKPHEATLTLSARQEGDHILIQVSDDGKGIDPATIKASALEKGLISEEEAASMSDRDAVYLIFRPNFSTRDKVTETSGRGVGMDVVKSSVEALKGEVRVQTEEGKGSTFTLILPLTLAVTRVLFVEVDEMVFGIPTSSVISSNKVESSEVKSIERREAIQVRDQTVPLVALSDVLRLPYNRKVDEDKISVIILNYAEEQMAFMVDRVICEQEIVIKTLGEHLQNVQNVAGAALQGNGDVVLIMHVPELFDSAKQSAFRRITDTRESQGVKRTKRILVVEDSLTTRELERNLLQSHGYDVEVAYDGMDGLQKAANSDFDLIMADIDMPRLNGFQMIQSLKANESLRSIPVVIVSALDREEDRRRGFELGAEAYVVKSAFDQTGLWDTIQRLIG